VRDGYVPNRLTGNVPIQIIAATAINLNVDFIWDYSYPTNSGQPEGVVTDGTSRFYIKVSDPGNTISQVTFSLFDEDNNSETKTLGKLMKASNIKTYDEEANNANSLSVPISQPQGNNEFWCWYVAPDDFIGSKTLSSSIAREVWVRIKAEYSNGTNKEVPRKITIKRPPVVLVHGLNGDISVWNSFSNSSSFLRLGSKLTIGGQDSYYNNALFITSQSGSSAFSIPGVIKEFREDKIACNQVYYVGHSMGGIVLRYAETYFPNRFFNQKNYNKGYVNKFITLDTPHKGSPFANILESKLPIIRVADVATFFKIGEIDKYYTRGSGLINDVQPAIKDLKMNSFNINPTAYKSHVIVGDMIDGLENLASLPENTFTNLSMNPILRLLFSLLYPGPAGLKGLDNDFVSLSDNSIANSDLIVPLNSQLSGLTQGNSLTTYTVNFHSEATGNPSIEKNSAEEVAILLDKPIMDNVWGSLPALKKATTNLLSKSSIKKIVSDSSFIDIFSPRNFDTLYIDSVFNLTFSISDTVNLKKILIIYQDKFIEDTLSQSNYNYSLSVSNNSLDTQRVTVLAYYFSNDSTIISGKSVTIIIKSDKDPIEIKSKENFVYLQKDEDYYPTVKAYFEKFIGEIGTTGTALNFVVANPEILSFNSVTKKLTAIKDGETSAIIEYGGLKDTIYFKINGDNITGIDEGENNSGNSNMPNKYELLQNYPNPFNPNTTITYQLPKSGSVTLKIFDVLGREVKTLVNEQKEMGRYTVTFNASSFASGMYVYQLRANDFISTKKMLLLK